MTSYTPNIPQPTDDPSDSQDQILENFQTLQSSYGTSGDHYPWTNTTPTEGLKHAKVTTPGLPTANPPGSSLPAPTAGNCAYFAQTRNSQTTPFISRDGLAPVAPLTNIWPLLPIKAFASFTMVANAAPPQVQTINESFNVTSITRNPALVFTVVMPNGMRTLNYGVYFLGGFFAAARFTAISTTTFTITLDAVSDGSKCSFFVLEP